MATPELRDAGPISSRMQQQPRARGDESEGYDSSGSDFDFGARVDGQAEAACSAADELFFNGKILPLELAPRLAAMGIQQEQDQDGRLVGAEISMLLRRGRSMGRSSTSSSASWSGSGGQPCTRKSSSYPPCGNKSSSIFRDLFGSSSSGKNSGVAPPQQQRPSKVLSSSKGLLKRVFANWSTSSSTSSVASSMASISSLPASPSSSPARSMAQLQQGKRKPSASTRRKAGELALPASVFETRSAPASPLSPHVRPRMGAGVAPVLHIGGFKHHQQQQQSSPSYYLQHRRKPVVAA